MYRLTACACFCFCSCAASRQTGPLNNYEQNMVNMINTSTKHQAPSTKHQYLLGHTRQGLAGSLSWSLRKPSQSEIGKPVKQHLPCVCHSRLRDQATTNDMPRKMSYKEHLVNTSISIRSSPASAFVAFACVPSSCDPLLPLPG